jgi:hypothetical protein
MGSGGDGGNLKNAIVAFLAPLPSILFYLSFLNRINASTGSEGDSLSLPLLWTWCYHHPLLLANALFFLNVNVLFWLIGHVQDSHWVRACCLLAAFCRFSFRLIVDFRCLVWFGLAADDRFVLDGDTGDACSLLRNSPFGSLQLVEVEDRDVDDLGVGFKAQP